jgi:hypothetical protein
MRCGPDVFPPEKPRGCLMWFADLEFIYWWVKKDSFPVLLTAGDPNAFQFGNGAAIPAALGQPGTVGLLGGFPGVNEHPGARLNLGLWLDPDQVLGIQGSFFWLGEGRGRYFLDTEATPSPLVIGRPFFDVANGVENVDPLNVPNAVAGQIYFVNSVKIMGAESNMVYNYETVNTTGVRYGVLAGGRIIVMDEFLNVSERIHQPADAFGNPDIQTLIAESFGTHNRFYGGQVGGQMELIIGSLYAQLVTKVAVGVNNETENILGNTLQMNPANAFLNLPTVSTSSTGLFVEPGNAGRFKKTVFSVVPEIDFNIGYAFNDNVMLKIGYTGLFWTDVVRPGKQMNRNITIQPLDDPVPVQPQSPLFTFTKSDIWMQGFNVGFELTF